VEILRIITQDVIKVYISRITAARASGLDKILNFVLKALKDLLTEPLERIFNRCLKLAYHLKYFRDAITVALRKADKDNYTLADNYRPIALLNILKKVLEAVIAEKIINAAEAHNLLSRTQMGVRRERFIVITLQLITEQATTV